MASNFEFLQSRWSDLHKQTVKAEAAFGSDVDVTAIHLRSFGERLTLTLLQFFGSPMSRQTKQFDRLRFLEENGLLSEEILGKFHAIRILGNNASHGGSVSREQAAGLLADAWSLAVWFCRLVAPGEDWTSLTFVPPTEPATSAAERPHESLEEALAETGSAEDRSAQPGPSQKIEPVYRIEAKRIREDTDRAFRGLDPETRRLRTPVGLKDAFAGVALSYGQEESIEALESFFRDRSEPIFLLKGYAGTGKTFLTTGLTAYLSAQGRSFRLCAPTGRAAKIIAEKTGHIARTIHSTIYNFKDLVEYSEDGLAGSETFKKYAGIAVNDDPANTVYIVDESSLVSDVYQEEEFFRSGSGYLLKDFFDYVGLDHNDHDKRIILIGDSAQLPPVDMSFSPALNADYLLRTYGVPSRSVDLKDIVRQKAESGVLANVTPLRESLEAGLFSKLTFDFKPDDIERIGVEEVLPRYLQTCDQAINGKSIIVTRSNAEAAEYNRVVRGNFFPGQAAVAPGDKLMVVANTTVDGLFISNGDFAFVRAVEAGSEARQVTLRRKNPDSGVVETVEITLSFRTLDLGVRDLQGKAHFFRTKIVENLLYNNDPSLGSDEQKALYIDFCTRRPHIKGTPEFLPALRVDPYFNALRVKFGYALTCHKAQGSEWEHVFVVCPSEQGPLSAGYFRWLYTAMTRTTNHLYMVNPPHREVGAEMKPVLPPHLRRGQLQTVPGGTQTPVLTEGSTQPPRSDLFGLSELDGILFMLLKEVQSVLEGSNIEITEIVHNQYQEAYFFRRDTASTRVNIPYNAKGKIGRIMPVDLGELGSELRQRLAPLADRTLTADPGGSSVNGLDNAYQPSQPFLGQLHGRLLQLAQQQGIRIVEVLERQWCQRYTFAREQAVVSVDIWYNARGVFGTFQPVNLSNPPPPLLTNVIDLLTTGLTT